MKKVAEGHLSQKSMLASGDKIKSSAEHAKPNQQGLLKKVAEGHLSQKTMTASSL